MAKRTYFSPIFLSNIGPGGTDINTSNGGDWTDVDDVDTDVVSWLGSIGISTDNIIAAGLDPNNPSSWNITDFIASNSDTWDYAVDYILSMIE